MYPHIHIGDISISVYWSMVFLGFIGMMILTVVRRKKIGLNVLSAVLFTVFTMICGLGGAKLLYIFENWKDTLENGVSLAGVSFFGSVFLIPLLMPLFGLLFRLKPGQSLDIAAPCVALMVGTIRVGCFFNGCCGGWTTASGFTWPTQAMESVCDYMLLFTLLQMSEMKRFRGALYPVFLVSYGFYRFLIEFLRDTPRAFLGLANGHLFALAAVAVGAVWIILLRKRVFARETYPDGKGTNS